MGTDLFVTNNLSNAKVYRAFDQKPWLMLEESELFLIYSFKKNTGFHQCSRISNMSPVMVDNKCYSKTYRPQYLFFSCMNTNVFFIFASGHNRKWCHDCRSKYDLEVIHQTKVRLITTIRSVSTCTHWDLFISGLASFILD